MLPRTIHRRQEQAWSIRNSEAQLLVAGKVQRQLARHKTRKKAVGQVGRTTAELLAQGRAKLMLQERLRQHTRRPK